MTKKELKEGDWVEIVDDASIVFPLKPAKGCKVQLIYVDDDNVGFRLKGYRQFLHKEQVKLVEQKEEEISITGWRRFDYPFTANNISKIYHSKSKGVTVVLFADGTKIKVKRSKGTTDDVYTAVAYAVCKKIYKSSTQFTKQVDKALVEVN